MIRKLQTYWRNLFDVREGERLRVLFMALHMLAALWSYYILRPVSRALFLDRFDIDQLPWLYILIAIVGGLLSYVYTKIAIRSSLSTAVTFTLVWSVTCLIAIWWMLQYNVTAKGYATADATPVSPSGQLELIVGADRHVLSLASGANHLNGARDAINAAGTGVTASVDRKEGDQPWLLALKADSPLVRSLALRTKPGDSASNVLSSLPWMLYVFEIWVKVFSIIIVSQGWLLAANVFNAREAKRVYGLLGAASVIGAALGATFTAVTVRTIGTRNLLLASVVTLFIGWLAFRLTAAQPGVSLAGARAAESEEEFSFRDIVGAVRSHRHLQVIIGVISLTYIVDVMVDYQWSAMAKATYLTREDLTVYTAAFQGPYTNAATFLLIMVTAWVVSRVGVGGTLQIMPVTTAAASLGIFFAPSIVTTSIARLMESSMRYSFNRTGMELLYLPLPIELKNRTKAFVDVFVDRVARGVGAMLLLLLTGALAFGVREISLVVVFFAVASILLCNRARKEYVATIRRRISARRLDLEAIRINVKDPATVRLLEETAAGPHPRQVTYALSLLAQVPGYDARGMLDRLSASASDEIRGKVYDIARDLRHPALLDAALAEIRTARPPAETLALRPAVAYAMAVSPEATALGTRLLDHPHRAVTERALESLTPEAAAELITLDWIRAAACEGDPARRALAAIAVRVRGDQGTEALHRLLQDPDPHVAKAACRAAATLLNRLYVEPLALRLADVPVRGAAIESLAAFGVRIVGTLGDMLEDERTPAAVRRQIPRVLRLIPNQRSVDVLLGSISQADLTLRGVVLRSLNHLRETAPNLEYGRDSVMRQILNEARYYFELNAALAPFHDHRESRSAAGLLAGTLEDRLKKTIERLFRLLGLQYPYKDIYSAYLAVHRGDAADHTAAVEFLDSVLDRDLKRVLLPLLDSADRLLASGRDLFGVDIKNAEDAVRELVQSSDPWLVACAIATAAELKMRSLKDDIARLAENGAGPDVVNLARSAALALG